jgi:hypothetical protein
MLFEHQSFVGPAEGIETEILPITQQMDFGPGSGAIMAMANTALENDLVIVKGLDPSKYAEEFPDWETRHLHVLCQAFSREDPELRIGWFSRLKLIPISTYRYRQARKWLKEGFPEELPDWVDDYYTEFADHLSVAAPELVPKVVQCPNCKKRNVSLEVTRRLDYMCKVGVLQHEGEDMYVPITEVDDQSTHTAQLRCLDCGAHADLEDSEWTLPGISS